jgi:16S rRNA (guanine527-N7)-methyltransferase
MAAENTHADAAITSDPAALAAALVGQGIALEPAQVELLDRYRAALWRWNEQLNLTRHTTLEKFVGRDVVDSLELARHIGPRRRVLDVGSGGGVPGIVIAICRPDLRVTLCESTQKKARVLESIVAELQLRVEAFGCRAEELLALRTFDVATARAVAPLAKILTWLAPHWSALDELLLVKGRTWVDERTEARQQGLLKRLALRKAAVYPMPGVEDGESVILRIYPKHEGDAAADA